MAEFPQENDPPPPPPSKPEFHSPVKTLDESSPTAPIRALVSHSLSLSSPIRQIQVFPLKESLIPIPIPIPIPNPSDKTLILPENDAQIIPQSQIPPDDENFPQIASSSYTTDSWNSPTQRRYMTNLPDYVSDDDEDLDLKIESTKLQEEIPWVSPMMNQPTGVGAGLDNSGNTCFIASVLQCFTHTVPLIESLLCSYKYPNPCNCGNEKFCVVRSLRDHIDFALRSSGYSLRVDWVRDNLNHFSPDFQINNQEDAHEFLQSFLDKLERCCLDRRVNKSDQDVNIVDHVFGGRLVSRLHCCNCDSFSDTFEPSLGWSLEIEDVDNLWSALESFTRVEKLEDQFTCDSCKEKVSKEKQLKLDKLPLVATFHLKRFKNDGTFMQKIFKHVEFPLELDLLPYMSNNQNPEVSTKYHLYAMVEHIGNGVSFGHYSSYVRSAPEIWHKFDDSKVTRISEENVLLQNAYLLFYAREGTPWFSTTYNELKTMFEANPINFSPKSVLETTCRQECVSDDHSYKNVGNSNTDSVKVSSIPDGNYSDFRCHEPQDDVFHSAESGSDDEYSMNNASKSLQVDESDKPFAETSRQEEPNKPFPETSCQEEEPKKPFAETSPQEEPKKPFAESSRSDVFEFDANVPVFNCPKQDSSPKRKADERPILSDAHRPKLKIQKPNSVPKRQGTFQIQRDHLQIKKKEEALVTKPFKRIVAADPKDTEIAKSYLNRNPTLRSRMLTAALARTSPTKKTNFTDIQQRSTTGHRRHVAYRQ